jgi:hypothetical protein
MMGEDVSSNAVHLANPAFPQMGNMLALSPRRCFGLRWGDKPLGGIRYGFLRSLVSRNVRAH